MGVEHNLSLAQALASNTANLQAAFSLVKDSYVWADRLVESARKADGEQSIGAALVTLGDALSRVATLPGEDRRARLLEALAAYDEALRFYRPDTAPLDYATTQNNRATLLRDIASLPGEDRRARLLEALAAYDEALRFRRPDTAPLAYAATQNNRAALLGDLASLPGEDRRARRLEALWCAWTALTMIEHIGHAPYAQIAANTLRGISEEAGEMFDELWAELNAGNPPAWLVQHLQWRLVPQALRDGLLAYLEARRRANEENAYETWEAAATSSRELLAHPDALRPPFALDELRADVADCWNRLGYILSDEQKKPEEALAAFEEAVRLRPGLAMYWRNHAGTNIDLGNLDAAAASLARAGELEPDHPRLAELHKELDEARRKLAGESGPP